MKRVVFAVPGDLATPTGGYAYDRRIIAELRQLGWNVDIVDLGEGFPRPESGRKAEAHKKLLDIPKYCPVIVDGLALGVLPEAAQELRERNPLVALVHHPLALETGISEADARSFLQSEKVALAAAAGVIASSPSTAQILLDDYDVPSELITIASPGTDRGTPAPGSQDGVVRLLSVGAWVPRKGFDVLVSALATLPDLPWRLSIVGDRSRDLATVAQVDAEIARHGQAGRIDILGTVPDHGMAAVYSQADIFVLASRFEGYGMAFAEAMAHGLPVIGTTAGAIPDTVPPEAGVLIEPNDVKALARALRMLIENEAERRWFAAGASSAAEKLPTWRQSAELVANAIEALA